MLRSISWSKLQRFADSDSFLGIIKMILQLIIRSHTAVIHLWSFGIDTFSCTVLTHQGTHLRRKRIRRRDAAEFLDATELGDASADDA